MCSFLEQQQQQKHAESTGWANVLQRLVHSRDRKKKKLLSKALKDTAKEIKSKDEEIHQIRSAKDELRKKPDFKDKDFDRMLQSIATKGVVQLFNAINEHQPPEENEGSTKNSKKTKTEEPINKFLHKWGELKDDEDEDSDNN